VTACTLTLSGAVTGTSGCQAVGTTDSNTSLTTVTITGAASSAYSGFDSVNALGMGDLANGTYSATNVSRSSTIVSVGTTDFWGAFAHDGSNPDQGTFSLLISSPGSKVTQAGVPGWPDPHGTLDATLLPAGGSASSAVTVHAAF
jgi:hypothetical protein